MGKVAAQQIGRRDSSLIRHAISLLLALIIHKEKSLVLDDRAAEVCSELIEAQLGLDPAERWRPAVRVQFVIPEELP